MYSEYWDFPQFNQRAVDALARYGQGRTMLVIGCGPGYMVNWLQVGGGNAYGIDGSAYAINRGKTEMPSIAQRLVQGDAMNAANMDAMRALAGIRGGQRFFVGITEDILPVLSDAEITALLVQARRCCTNLLHIITCDHPESQHCTQLNWKTPAQWRALLGPTDIIYDDVAQSLVP